jgi:hypothetical protein
MVVEAPLMSTEESKEWSICSNRREIKCQMIFVASHTSNVNISGSAT